jgi:pyrroloquinoline quinone (PQQ) biosynthesis protein C
MTLDADQRTDVDDDPADGLADVLDATLRGRLLVEHPFHLRWCAGELAPVELADFAVQYRAFEELLPGFLHGVVEELEDEGEVEAAELVRRNLRDEQERPAPHLALFDRFADALPAPRRPEPGPAARDLVATYGRLAECGPLDALAGLAAYESQAAEFTRRCGEAIRSHYGLGDEAAEFWEVHARMEVDHGEWALEALFVLGADAGDVVAGAEPAARAWWAVLDELDRAAPVG